ncbi:hypothetical protein PR202_gb07950 [Eleusine coracana subsp. coracana]|uniref:Uncharacterized protein n=1 Tax=Eleusine coracana subsp. coracana TaxID=191504 RepID=A0AAV5EDW6_ELECO|nr:hypothetical protein PR202_gb07950 [Eleusine coracana subsp. coracana]
MDSSSSRQPRPPGAGIRVRAPLVESVSCYCRLDTGLKTVVDARKYVPGAKMCMQPDVKQSKRKSKGLKKGKCEGIQRTLQSAEVYDPNRNRTELEESHYSLSGAASLKTAAANGSRIRSTKQLFPTKNEFDSIAESWQQMLIVILHKQFLLTEELGEKLQLNVLIAFGR